MIPLLLTMLALPFAAAVTLVLLAPPRESARWIALAGSLATLVPALALAGAVFGAGGNVKSSSAVAPRFVTEVNWFEYAQANGDPISVDILLGVDRIGLVMSLATILVTACCVLASWSRPIANAPWFYAAMLSLEGAALGQFAAFDLISFYALFEFTLVPLYFLIAMWGDVNGAVMARRSFVYLFTMSVFMFAGLALLASSVAAAGLKTPCSIPAISAWLADHPLDPNVEIAAFCLIAIGVLAKTPMAPLHTWLPGAHAASPTAANALFAGILLKPFGLLRICLPLFPMASVLVGVPVIGALSVVAIVYGSLCAVAQTDLKRLLAYSSVAHMGACTLGLVALNAEGITGGVILMVAHGIVTAGLFLLFGALCDGYGVRELGAFGGIAAKLPALATLLTLLVMASVGLPGLAVFPGEFLAILGMFKTSWPLAVIAGTGVVLSAWYLLSALARVAFGPPRGLTETPGGARDLVGPELLGAGLLGVACVVLGVYPQMLVEAIRPDVDRLAALYSDGQNSADPVAIIEPNAAIKPLAIILPSTTR
jgi:NADH-quinone oxidoreductase subunit M